MDFSHAAVTLRLLLAAFGLLASPALGQGVDYLDLPPIEDDEPVVGSEADEVVGVDLVDKRGQTVPKNLRLTQPDGQVVTLGQLLDGPPMLLCLNYSRCPMLCGEQQRRLAEGLGELTLEPGEDYRFVSVSIDPLESPVTAGETRLNFVRVMQKSPLQDGIHFLVAPNDRATIDRLADAVGFDYEFVPSRNEYAHNARMFVLSPDGLITRSLNGFYGTGPEQFDQRTLRLSIVEASDGKVSSLFDNVMLQCFRYDAMTGKYTPLAWGIMRTGAVVTVLVMAAVFLPVWLRASRRGRGEADEASVDVDEETTAMEAATPVSDDA